MSLRFPEAVCCGFAAMLFASGGASARELKVCADPNNMPFSNEQGQGFENRLAELVAKDMGATVKFVWKPEWRGFVRKGLNAHACDVVPGVPANYGRVLPTKPYYRASYAIVQPAVSPPIASFDDPALQTARIGVQLVGDDGANTPPMDELAKHGLTHSIRGYMVFGDWSKPDPLAPIVDAVAHRDVDVAFVWGPVADYYGARETPPLRVTHIDSMKPMTFSISMGVRKRDKALADEINRILERRQSDIQRILAEFHIQSSGPSKSATAE